jgi:glucose-1-phosphate thymidylyltransferase
MKALVLAGGRGTRLRPFSHTMAKQLIPIANKPVLQYVLENIRDIGVTDIGMIVGDRAEEISAVFGDGLRLGVHITYIRQLEPLGLAHCVSVARSFLGADDFVMYLGDNMLPEGIREAAAQFAAGRPAAQVLVREVPDPRAFGVAEVDENGTVLSLAEKPARPRSNLAIIGVYFFTEAIHDAVTAVGCSARGEQEITDAIQWLLRQGAVVKVGQYHGYWKDTGIPEDVLDCNRRIMSKLRARVAGEVDAGSELYGPVVIEPGARIVRSRIIGPVIIGAGTLIQDSFVGPDTAIGQACVLRETELANSIVLDGASIAEVPGLHGSLIGRSATVGVVDRMQAHHRLIVGDHGRVMLATSQAALSLVASVRTEQAALPPPPVAGGTRAEHLGRVPGQARAEQHRLVPELAAGDVGPVR